MEMTKYFDDITFHHIPREKNQLADVLATLSSMYKVSYPNHVPSVAIERREKPAYCFAVEEEKDGRPWYYDIKNLIKNKVNPAGASELDKKTFRMLAAGFFLDGEVLYKRNYDKVLLRCVKKREADMLIEEIHEGAFGTHANGHAMAKKILRAGYYWLTMQADCISYARKCHKC
jgi:hypothetical protein